MFAGIFAIKLFYMLKGKFNIDIKNIIAMIIVVIVIIIPVANGGGYLI